MFCVGWEYTQSQSNTAIDKSSTSLKVSELINKPYLSSGTLKNPVLVLVLHGDSPFENPSYQYKMAERIAAENTNVVVVGVLRPGYTDGEGNSSKGKRGKATGDNYTKEVLVSIYNLTMVLKKKYQPSKVMLIGHSGGAAISANLIAVYADIYSDAVLISCNCDIHLWRKHMKQLQSNAPIWDEEISSLSPIKELQNIDNSTQIMVVHGENDEIVPIHMARDYVDALEANKKKVRFIILKGQGHEVAFNDDIFDIVKRMLN